MPINISYLIIISVFLIYYLIVLFSEKKIIQDPKEIIDKFLSTILLYAGVSLIFFSLTGKPFLGDSLQAYNIYIFIIGFIAVLWTIPNLLQEFRFFRKFSQKRKR
jgi:hypothetical protein